MSNAIEVIDQEIDEISEMLKHHAYQLQVLTDLRHKIDGLTGEVAVVKKPKRKKSPSKFQQDCAQLSEKVADLIRSLNLSKSDAVRYLINTGECDLTLERAVAMCSPTNIGSAKKYRQIFKGTKYAK